jgi:4-hydroxybenzoate polyprenyltransferase
MTEQRRTVDTPSESHNVGPASGLPDRLQACPPDEPGFARRIAQILEMIRFSHTLFALPFALLAAIMAWTTPTANSQTIAFRWQDFVGIVVCMVAARSAAMAFNRLADLEIDAQNPRTAGRHLPTGVLSVHSVVAFTAFCSAAFVASTLLFLPNWLPLAASLPVLGVLFGYSYSKRFTWLSHFWLGLALMLAPIAAWIAIRGLEVWARPLDALPPCILGASVLLWVAGFDIIYACLDVEFDRRKRLHSVPARFGVAGALRLAGACHFGMILMLLTLPLACPQLPLGWLYWLGIIGVAVLLVVEHLLVNPEDLKRVNMAFFNVNAVVSIGLFLFGAVDLLT